MPNPKQFGTNFPFQVASQCWGGLADQFGYFVIATFRGDKSNTMPTATSTFAAGCILINTSLSVGLSTTTAVWVNTGSATTPSWTSLTIS